MIFQTLLYADESQAANSERSLHSFFRINNDISTKYPKILWLDYKQDILSTLIINHLKHVFSKQNYEIRFIDPLKSYQYLSN